MAVYVDDMNAPFGRMKMCHMAADTTIELMAMADSIGVPRRYVQYAGTPREHFDVSQTKKKLAVGHGAMAIPRRFMGRYTRAKRDPLFFDALRTLFPFVDHDHSQQQSFEHGLEYYGGIMPDGCTTFTLVRGVESATTARLEVSFSRVDRIIVNTDRMHLRTLFPDSVRACWNVADSPPMGVAVIVLRTGRAA